MRAEPPVQADKISVLVVSPTRELALQIAKEAEMLIKGTEFKVRTVVGGTNVNTERNNLRRRTDVLVAVSLSLECCIIHLTVAASLFRSKQTPGRFLDHVKTSELKPKLSQLRSLVLDEADRLLDAGFRRDLLAILEALPDRETQPRYELVYSLHFTDCASG